MRRSLSEPWVARGPLDEHLTCLFCRGRIDEGTSMEEHPDGVFAHSFCLQQRNLFLETLRDLSSMEGAA